ncbi:uncharacterized protein [Amphiura filiformis]|uniref:uncharacterized protein n=1 Tax=Amphiura filiformis TaxID=82378 RepID=UPI003B224E89
MDAHQLCGVILLVVVAVVGDPLTVDSLTRRQNQITLDTFIFFQEQIEVHVYYIEKRITELEEKVRILEEGRGSSAQPGEDDTRPGQPDQPRQPEETGDPDPHQPEPGPEPTPDPGPGPDAGPDPGPDAGPDPGPDAGPDSGREEPENENPKKKPKPGKGKKPKPDLPTTLMPTTAKPATTMRVTTTPPGAQYDRTCAEIFNHGYIYSADYTVDPDRDGPIEPFTVFCDMESGEGITQVGHSDEQPAIPVNGFENPGSFNLEPVYANGATMEQLGAMADASKSCRQYVKYACKNSGLMQIDTASGLTYAWWRDRNGEKRINFGGAPTDSGKCACAFGGPNGDENTCFLGSQTCSCDHQKAKNQFDEGEFTDKHLLPVMSINLGDTGSRKERGAITLGKLICEG